MLAASIVLFTGAMYFSIAVILIYGISIAMLVAASTLRRSHTDYELKSFMRSYSRIDVERRSLDKQRTTAILHRLNHLQREASGVLSVPAPQPTATASLASSGNVRPDKLSGFGLLTPVGSVRLECSPPTVIVVDNSAGESYNGASGDMVLPDAVAFGINALVPRPQQKKELVVREKAPDHARRLPSRQSEKSLLVPKYSDCEFDVQRTSSRRNTAA